MLAVVLLEGEVGGGDVLVMAVPTGKATAEGVA